MAERDPEPDWRPTASLDALRRRAELSNVVRRFFADHGFLEVETPILSRDVVVDAHLDPLAVERGGAREPERFLQTSPEFPMKRLLAAGATAIWQAARVVRRGEHGRWHEPEFTMLEWYRIGDDHAAQMAFTEELAATVLAAGQRERWRNVPRSFDRLTYRDAFRRHADVDPFTAPGAKLRAVADSRGVSLPASIVDDDRDELLNVLLATLVEPHLGRDRPTFLCDYPPSQAALARIRQADPPVAERFELYVDGLELANGYHELLDAAELRRRNRVQNELRRRDGLRALPEESRLLEAMEAGLPACSGVALGFDRFVAVALGAESLAEVVAFPWDRA